jgi:hypothetical protein
MRPISCSKLPRKEVPQSPIRIKVISWAILQHVIARAGEFVGDHHQYFLALALMVALDAWLIDDGVL